MHTVHVRIRWASVETHGCMYGPWGKCSPTHGGWDDFSCQLSDQGASVDQLLPHSAPQFWVWFPSVVGECLACLEMHSTETCTFLFQKNIKLMSLWGQVSIAVCSRSAGWLLTHSWKAPRAALPEQEGTQPVSQSPLCERCAEEFCLPSTSLCP